MAVTGVMAVRPETLVTNEVAAALAMMERTSRRILSAKTRLLTRPPISTAKRPPRV